MLETREKAEIRTPLQFCTHEARLCLLTLAAALPQRRSAPLASSTFLRRICR